MKILFLHPNFPGQFKHIASDFARTGNDVRFICQTHYDRKIPNLRRYCIKGKLGDDELKRTTNDALSRAQKMATQYEKAFEILDKEWNPHLVISHSGWGCGAYVKKVWPECNHITYLEWWFDVKSSLFTYDEHNPDLLISPATASKQWMRNSLQALELVNADKIVSPTQWQREQLPDGMKKVCEVIHDGIDDNKFKFSTNRTKAHIITYGTRGMEPMRCFPQFIRSIPEILSNLKDYTVEIAGVDEINYGGRKPKEGSWKKWALNFLESKGINDKVKWVGRLKEPKYIRWLQRSTCHVYLTHPYVVSWSFIEAIFCNCRIVASKVEPIKEFSHAGNITMVDHRVISQISQGVIKTCKDSLKTDTTSHDFKQKRGKELTLENAIKKWRAVAGLDLTTPH